MIDIALAFLQVLNESPNCFSHTAGTENLPHSHSVFKGASSHLGTGLANKAANYYSLGLESMGVQPTQDIVHLPVPPSAAAGQSAFGSGSLALNGELLKFIMPSGRL